MPVGRQFYSIRNKKIPFYFVDFQVMTPCALMDDYSHHIHPLTSPKVIVNLSLYKP